ncbi:cytochrome P450 89A2-like isoform X1 [Iris pallida]|uniref:Cytochrome P450 89A2-like isoform X1 n=1 Tax=Iris pallida TaxID=29817 RepID=A0AAX6GYK8_IRIPA|nr:cytochrome P450 89A2-like isoform X1 [Iris pallida]
MCFGEKLDEKVISEIETVLRSLLSLLEKAQRPTVLSGRNKVRLSEPLEDGARHGLG